MEIREEVIHQGPEEQIETPTKDETWEIIRTLNNSLSPGEAISVQNLSSMEKKNYRKKFTYQ